MFKIYQPEIYGLFFKELRKKNKYTIADLSKKTHYSSATLSNLENIKTIPNEDKLNFMLTFYHLPNDYFKSFSETIDALVDQLIIGIIYINDTVVEENLEKITQALIPYQNTSLFLVFNFCKVIHTLYYNQSVDEKDIHFLIDHSFYFSKELQYIIHVYIAYHYLQPETYDLCEHYLYQAGQFNLSQHIYNLMTNYFLALLYSKKNDIVSSMKYLNYAQKDFVEHQNYKRLINLNIISSLQYMTMGEYSKAIEVNQNNLIAIEEMNLTLERTTVLYNTAFIYIIRKEYDTALKYLLKIPKTSLSKKHYSAIAYCLIEKNEFNKAIDYINDGLKINNDLISDELLNIYLDYCQSLNIKQFAKELSNYYSKNKHLFQMLTKEYFLNILMTQYLKLGFIANMNDYLYELYMLRIH